ncbi:MAG: hydroxymethylglutaryl-CoA reductase [Candidatus Omnitrophica bacterium]|nr:hydroxymethylglutaryl-CoA reductase [Candidatus Omnitrophota bacterium]
MALSKSHMNTRLNTLVDAEVLDRVTDNRKLAAPRKESRKAGLPNNKPYLTGQMRINDAGVFDGNIENFFGVAQIPVGLIGPLQVNGATARQAYHVPLATTEGALVASLNRGAKVITLSGGANVLCLSETITRSPGFIFADLLTATRFVAWVSENFDAFKDIVRTTTRHGHLEDFDAVIDGKYVWINLKYVSGDAAGQNMVTFATDAICRHIAASCPFPPKKWYIDANMSGDKKATRLSMLSGRGKSMAAEVIISKTLCKRALHVTPAEIVEYSKMALVAGIHSGSIGVNGHYANALAAMFIACGQDAACVAESATGTSKAELTEEGDLYVSITVPNLVVGTVGGGTPLPTQRECLEMMDCYGSDRSKKFAEICAATILAGEISIAAAIAGGHFTQAHKVLGRKSALKKVGKNEDAPHAV